MDARFAEELKKTLPDCPIFWDEPMSAHTSFKIGGPADLLALPRRGQDLATLVKLLHLRKVPYLIIGNGSNLLVSDRGIRGAVIKTTGLCQLSIEGDILSADCGTPLSKLSVSAQEAGLSGLEFAFGIPGTLGGAIFMNAGAYGGQMSDIVESSDCLDANGDAVRLSEHDFSYRHSVFSDQLGLCHLSSTLRLYPGDKVEIAARMKAYMEKRAASQPLNLPSAGSVFKRPAGHFAGTLIEQAGLKGACVGGAQVSLKHAGFIVNLGGATCQDVLLLIDQVRKTVYAASGVNLEPEIRAVGEF